MKAMIFAAGMGTRLKPLTDRMPKALVPVGGKPLIEHVCKKLMASGIDEAVVNVHHFADMIEEWAEGQEWISKGGCGAGDGLNMKVEFSDERAMLLETGGAVLHARKYLEGCGSFLIHNVDILSNADLEWFAAQVRPDAVATLLVSNREATRYFLFHPETMRLVGWMNAKSEEYILNDPTLAKDDCRRLGFSGIHIMSDRIFALMDEYVSEKGLPTDEEKGTKFPIRDFYLWAAEKHPVYGVAAENLELLDVGKLDSLELAETFVNSCTK